MFRVYPVDEGKAIIFTRNDENGKEQKSLEVVEAQKSSSLAKHVLLNNSTCLAIHIRLSINFMSHLE